MLQLVGVKLGLFLKIARFSNHQYFWVSVIMGSSEDSQNAFPNAELVFKYFETNLKHSEAISLAQKNPFLS